MLNIARRRVPFTPLDKDLSTATVALVSATGVFAPPSMTSSIGNLAREIEARGVPTLILSASPAATESVTKVIR